MEGASLRLERVFHCSGFTFRQVEHQSRRPEGRFLVQGYNDTSNYLLSTFTASALDPLHHDRRVSADKRIWRNIRANDCARRHDGTFPDFHTRQYDRAGRNPAPGADGNRPRYQIERLRPEIVGPSAEISSLRDAHIRLDYHGRQAENPDILPDPNVVADAQPPRKGDVRVLPDDHACANLSVESAQKRDPYLRRPRQGILEK